MRQTCSVRAYEPYRADKTRIARRQPSHVRTVTGRSVTSGRVVVYEVETHVGCVFSCSGSCDIDVSHAVGNYWAKFNNLTNDNNTYIHTYIHTFLLFEAARPI